MTDHNRRAADIDIATMRVEIDDIKNHVDEMRADVKCLLAKMNQAKGGWMTLIAVAGIAGSMGALVSKLMPFMGGLPK